MLHYFLAHHVNIRLCLRSAAGRHDHIHKHWASEFTALKSFFGSYVQIQCDSLARGPKLLPICWPFMWVLWWNFVYTYLELCTVTSDAENGPLPHPNTFVHAAPNSGTLLLSLLGNGFNLSTYSIFQLCNCTWSISVYLSLQTYPQEEVGWC